MVYKVVIAQAAEWDIEEAFEYIGGSSIQNATKWLNELIQQIGSLTELPLRQPLIPEAELLKRQLRSLNHFSHRIIYEVDDEKLIDNVVCVYHGARAQLTPRDIQ